MGSDKVYISVLLFVILLLSIGYISTSQYNSKFKSTMKNISPDINFNQSNAKNISTNKGICWKYIPTLVRKKCPSDNYSDECIKARELWGYEIEQGESIYYSKYMEVLDSNKEDMDIEDFEDYFDTDEASQCYRTKELTEDSSVKIPLTSNYPDEQDRHMAQIFINDPLNYLKSSKNYMKYMKEARHDIDVDKKLSNESLYELSKQFFKSYTQPDIHNVNSSVPVYAWNGWYYPYAGTHIQPSTEANEIEAS